MSAIYTPRIRRLRSSIIKELPSIPNDKASRATLEGMSTNQLIVSFITWRMRRIPAKPRKVSVWTHGVTPSELCAAEPKLLEFLKKVEAGADLTDHLSLLVKRSGVVLPGANPAHRGSDIDAVLTRYGLHHFHVGVISPTNPTGRSGYLIFAEVLESEFRIVAISNHGAFNQGSAEQLKFREICLAYVAKDLSPGQAFMPNPVMSSGHALIVNLFANQCEHQMDMLDQQLDEPAFIDKLYNDQLILRDGKRVGKPPKPQLAWHFDDLKFGILDRKTGVFFCIFPFFQR